jgi:hypothetical protein
MTPNRTRVIIGLVGLIALAWGQSSRAEESPTPNDVEISSQYVERYGANTWMAFNDLVQAVAKRMESHDQMPSPMGPHLVIPLKNRKVLDRPNSRGQWWVRLDRGDGPEVSDIFCRTNPTTGKVEVYAYAKVGSSASRWIPVDEWHASFGGRRIQCTPLLEQNPFERALTHDEMVDRIRAEGNETFTIRCDVE